MATAAVTPRPGDFAVCTIGGEIGRGIALAERLAGGGFSQFQHALMLTEAFEPGDPRGAGLVVQAEPGGAVEVPIATWQAGHHLIKWSSGAIEMTDTERGAVVAAARHYAAVHTGYSDLDYLAIGEHHFVPWLNPPIWPGGRAHHYLPVTLRTFIKDTGHMQCAQLIDQSCLDGGVHLFADGRWQGYVDPSDLGGLIDSGPGWGLAR